ncbi:hypothetical protein ATZ33_14735 [Enterococcus silesiacus]|uniref:Signal peptidase I n=1 Tax=Enterococcus silesiacus TaxID=332949 RepID=A0A0S3KE65_9ENTE|nr:signal peptidase I [Enterococcus silesiacus]ALS02586.1 hypothetical protein ATZ33_14735 [Enterococcus silesiacus]OJG93491.1 signal peptidase I [Enterococcus silesiacus]
MQKKVKKNPLVGESNPKKNRSIIKGLFLFSLVIACLWFLICVKTHRIDGHSMEPTLINNDRVLVFKKVAPKKRSLITFSPKDKPNSMYVKRVIGMPGDKIQLEQTSLTIFSAKNEKQKKVALFEGDQPDGTTTIALSAEVARLVEHLTEIPENKYFVLGDNRKKSRDSRQLGLIDRSQIEGVVKYRYYPISTLGCIDE